MWTVRRDRPDLGAEGSLADRPALRLREAGRRRPTDPWYFTADRRAHRRDRVAAGSPAPASQWNNHYAAIYLGPDRAAYVATLAGLVRLAGRS